MPLWAVLLAAWVIAIPVLVAAGATVRAAWIERRDDRQREPALIVNLLPQRPRVRSVRGDADVHPEGPTAGLRRWLEADGSPRSVTVAPADSEATRPKV